MDTVAKKRTEPVQSALPEPEAGQLLVRVPDARILAALDAFAAKTRRSRNMAIVIILEDAMAAAGLWPPPKD